MLKYGSAKVKYTANATCRQISVLQAAQAVKADVLTERHHLVDATKEAVSAVANAEATTVVAETTAVEMIAEARVVLAARIVAVAAVIVQVAVAQIAEAVIAPADQAEEDKLSLES